MKLRIRGNSLRLRLTVGEVECLRATGEVSDAIAFGPEKANRLIYAIETDDSTDSVRTRFGNNRITVLLPPGIARDWFEGEETGLAADQSANGNGGLSILVEKDFACLKDRPGEDESDCFPNPAASAAC